MFYSHVKDLKMTTHPVYKYICIYTKTYTHTCIFIIYIYINARTYTIHFCIIVTPKRYRKLILNHYFSAILRSYLFDGYYMELQFETNTLARAHGNRVSPRLSAWWQFSPGQAWFCWTAMGFIWSGSIWTSQDVWNMTTNVFETRILHIFAHSHVACLLLNYIYGNFWLGFRCFRVNCWIPRCKLLG
jgi:hypothetical protein